MTPEAIVFLIGFIVLAIVLIVVAAGRGYSMLKQRKFIKFYEVTH